MLAIANTTGAEGLDFSTEPTPEEMDILWFMPVDRLERLADNLPTLVGPTTYAGMKWTIAVRDELDAR